MSLIAVFIRHADYQQLPNTPSAHQPFPLTEKGKRQAQTGARLISDMALAHNWKIHPLIHCSNLLRAWQTADLISKQLDAIIDIQGFDALAERSMGSAANLTLNQVEQVLDQDPRFDNPPPNWKSNSEYCLPLQGAESLLDSGKRIATHVRQQMDNLQLSGQTRLMQLFVGHGAAFRHAAYHLGALAFDDIAKLSMYHVSPVAFEVNTGAPWKHVAGEWKIRPLHDLEMD